MTSRLSSLRRGSTSMLTPRKFPKSGTSSLEAEYGPTPPKMRGRTQVLYSLTNSETGRISLCSGLPWTFYPPWRTGGLLLIIIISTFLTCAPFGTRAGSWNPSAAKFCNLDMLPTKLEACGQEAELNPDLVTFNTALAVTCWQQL